MTLNVKNTFINVEVSPEDEDFDVGLYSSERAAQRQVTEPAPFSRKMSDVLPPMHLGDFPDETTSAAEPEQEPHKDSDILDFSGDDEPWGRLVTDYQFGSQPEELPQLEAEAPYAPYMYANGTEGRTLPMSMMPMPVGLLPLCFDNSLVEGVTPCVSNKLRQPPEEWATTHTVMMRNLPNKYTQHMLIEDINSAGFVGAYDFFYLPIDPDTKANRGYAFINFIEPGAAWTFKEAYEGFQMDRFNSGKQVVVTPAALQGFEANYAHYSNSRVSRAEPEARPLFLRESPKVPQQSGTQNSGRRRRGGRRSLIDVAAQVNAASKQPASFDGSAAKVPSKIVSKAPAEAIVNSAQNADRHVSALSYCPYCGGRACDDFRFCQFCGASFNFGKSTGA
eukprot:CAMPEP_0117536100 /NCGR_PEP_ID=MMETSP0784-20121206/41277_1 /TAXON_ID=39447 /ORGANISM="" /LENGTH=391 /DNA_ID=CAMNT_0005332649 /DNA_START=9 /DNA_END=1184 /DNA_ORIENTATION=+